MTEAAVVTQNLQRRYDDRIAVRGISLEIPHGEIFGLLGPNGAGKSTTLSMISTRIRPTSGDAWVYGQHVVKNVHAVRRLLNVAPQEEALYPTLTAVENLAFFARLYGVPSGDRARRIADALDAVALTARKDDRVDTYSGGMRRRLNLGCALVTGPRLVLLDEPTVGVDPQSRAHIFDAVRHLRAQGMTIVYTTHYLEEAEDLCDRIAVMDDGAIVALGTLPELLASSKNTDIIEFRLAGPPGDLTRLAALPHVDRVESAGTQVRVFTSHEQEVLTRVCGGPSLFDREIVHTRVSPVTLEHVFMELTGKALRD